LSLYRNLYSDLPIRVYEVWKSTQCANVGRDFSVTAMLMPGSAGFSMPLELLKDLGVGNRKGWNAHPGFEHTQHDDYARSLKKCESPNEVTRHKGKAIGDVLPAAEHADHSHSLPSDAMSVRELVRILRNAHAHCRVAAQSDTHKDICDLVVFVRRSRLRGSDNDPRI
jgi:hypothetical protein